MHSGRVSYPSTLIINHVVELIVEQHFILAILTKVEIAIYGNHYMH